MVVLVVDDEEAIVQLLAEILTDEGCEVYTAEDGKIALHLLHHGLRPHLVISDIMMPGLDGIGLHAAIRQDLGLANIGIILMSAGRARPPHLNDPATRFIAKPFDVGELLETVTELPSHVR